MVRPSGDQLGWKSLPAPRVKGRVLPSARECSQTCGLVQAGEQPRLALETRHPIGVVGEDVGQQLERHLAPELAVARPPDFAHAPRTERGNDLVRAESSAG